VSSPGKKRGKNLFSVFVWQHIIYFFREEGKEGTNREGQRHHSSFIFPPQHKKERGTRAVFRGKRREEYNLHKNRKKSSSRALLLFAAPPNREKKNKDADSQPPCGRLREEKASTKISPFFSLGKKEVGKGGNIWEKPSSPFFSISLEKEGEEGERKVLGGRRENVLLKSSSSFNPLPS